MLLIGNIVYTSNDISVLILITDHVESCQFVDINQ